MVMSMWPSFLAHPVVYRLRVCIYFVKRYMSPFANTGAVVIHEVPCLASRRPRSEGCLLHAINTFVFGRLINYNYWNTQRSQHYAIYVQHVTNIYGVPFSNYWSLKPFSCIWISSFHCNEGFTFESFEDSDEHRPKFLTVGLFGSPIEISRVRYTAGVYLFYECIMNTIGRWLG